MTTESMRERFEAWLTSINGGPMYWNTSDAMLAAWQAATLSERERCAKVCEQINGSNWAPAQCAEAIRKGG